VPPRWWAVWTAGYFVLLVLVLMRGLAASEATRVSGRFLFVLTALWAAAALTAAVLTGRSISIISLASIGALTTAAWLLRGHAVVFGETREGTVGTAAECGRRLCLAGERTADGYTFVLSGGALHVRLRAIGSATWISQRASPPHRKAELFAQLLAKRYRGPLPVIRIRLK
jgi:hypothetical protein